MTKLKENQGYYIFAHKLTYANANSNKNTKDRVSLGYNPEKSEYVTWISRDGVDGYYNGHYFPCFNAAVQDFKERY